MTVLSLRTAVLVIPSERLHNLRLPFELSKVVDCNLKANVNNALRATNREIQAMEMHDENSAILQPFSVNGENGNVVPSQTNDSHIMDRSDHIQQTSANGSGTAISQANVNNNTHSQQRLSNAGHVSQALPSAPSQVTILRNDSSVKVEPKQENQQETTGGLGRVPEAHVRPLSQGPETAGSVQDGQPQGHGVQSGRVGETSQQENNDDKDKQRGIGMQEVQTENAGKSGNNGEVIGSQNTQDPRLNTAEDQGGEQGQTNVGTIAGVVLSNNTLQRHSGGNKEAEVGAMPDAHLTADGMKKEGIIYHQTGSTMVAMNNGNNDGRGMSVETLTKKSTRMPGTKQCPSCRNTIAAAVAKCPKCPHVFREKKEKVKRSGKRGKKNCPKCKFENPSACSSCKQCKYIFRLKLMDKYKAMRPARQPNDSAAASFHGQQTNVTGAMAGNVPGSVSGSMTTVPIPPGVSSYSNQFSQAMHAAAAHGMPVMQSMAPHTIALPPQSHSIHPTNIAQMQQQLPQHPMQPHQSHPQL